MLRKVLGRGATAEAEEIPADELKKKISGKGVNRDFLAYLDQYYDLGEVWTWLQKGDAQQLAQTTGYTGEVKKQTSGGGEGAKDTGQRVDKGDGERQQSKQQPKQQTQKAESEHVRGSRDTWGARLFAEGFLTMIAFSLWVANGVATVYAIMAGSIALFGDNFGTVLGLLLGPPIHYGITRVELYLWGKWRVKEYLLALVLCSGFDIISTMYSVGAFFKTRLENLATLPDNPLRWPWEILLAVWTWGKEQALTNRKAPDFDPSTLPDLQVPEWWFSAVLMVILAVGIAIVSERLLRRYRSGFINTWRERYGTR